MSKKAEIETENSASKLFFLFALKRWIKLPTRNIFLHTSSEMAHGNMQNCYFITRKVICQKYFSASSFLPRWRQSYNFFLQINSPRKLCYFKQIPRDTESANSDLADTEASFSINLLDPLSYPSLDYEQFRILLL